MLIVAIAAPASAAESECVAAEDTPGQVICSGDDEMQPVRRQQPNAPSTSYPFQELWRPVLSQDEAGNPCIGSNTVRLGREPLVDEISQSERQFFLYMRTYQLCPDAELPQTTPAMEAAAFLRRVGLPVPAPEVEPGRLPVGFESFLETGAPTSQTYGPVDTPFGPLTLTAAAEVYVDWDDPHDDVDGWDGPFTGEPGPYPEGEIRHVYQYDGWYEIAVRYAWTADWVIGGITGTIAGVETSGTYPAPGFEAYSRQAVG